MGGPSRRQRVAYEHEGLRPSAEALLKLPNPRLGNVWGTPRLPRGGTRPAKTVLSRPFRRYAFCGVLTYRIGVSCEPSWAGHRARGSVEGEWGSSPFDYVVKDSCASCGGAQGTPAVRDWVSLDPGPPSARGQGPSYPP